MMPRHGCSCPLPHIQAQHMIGPSSTKNSSAMRGSCSPARNLAMIPLICRGRRQLTVRGVNLAVSRRKPTPSNNAIANGRCEKCPGRGFLRLVVFWASTIGEMVGIFVCRCHPKVKCGSGRIKTAAPCHHCTRELRCGHG